MSLKFIKAVLIGTILMTLIIIVVESMFNSFNVISTTWVLWQVVSNLLIAIVLGLCIVNSNFSKTKLILSTIIIYFGIQNFNTLIEALIFDVMNHSTILRSLCSGFLITVSISPILVYLFGRTNLVRENQNFIKRNWFSWMWRIVLGSALYVFFYLLAGIILISIYPEVMDFYKGKMPSFSLIVKTQILRGVIFTIIAVVALRSLNLSIFKKALVLGLLFSILGGIAPLIQPNDSIPYFARIGHIFEVGISNFVYGIVLGYLLSLREGKG